MVERVRCAKDAANARAVQTPVEPQHELLHCLWMLNAPRPGWGRLELILARVVWPRCGRCGPFQRAGAKMFEQSLRVPVACVRLLRVLPARGFGGWGVWQA